MPITNLDHAVLVVRDAERAATRDGLGFSAPRAERAAT